VKKEKKLCPSELPTSGGIAPVAVCMRTCIWNEHVRVGFSFWAVSMLSDTSVYIVNPLTLLQRR
jgi:hypothetical protein